MNILLIGGLPEQYKGIPISTDFRNMIRVDLILHDGELSETEKAFASLNQLYPEIPKDGALAVEGLSWFFMRGKATRKDSGAGNPAQSEKKGLDFNQDANLVYSAFYSTYGLNLADVDFLHWWEFMALFEGLPETTLIKKVMYWRTVEVSDLPKEERKYILKMRNLFALETTEKKALNVDELNQQTKERIARRYKEVQSALGKTLDRAEDRKA